MKGIIFGIFIFRLFFWENLNAQIVNLEKPKICTTPPDGYTIGGRIVLSPPISCVNGAMGLNTNIRINNAYDYLMDFTLDKPIFFVDIDDNFNIESKNGFNGVDNQVNVNLLPGKHWILLKGEKNGRKYLTCGIQENILSETPKIVKDTCYLNKMSFEIPRNQVNSHDFYYVDWGDGDKDTLNMKQFTLPLKLEKTYADAVNVVNIRGVFKRNNITTCPTNLVTINPLIKNTYPIISNLTPDENKNSIRLKYSNMFPDEISEVEGIRDIELNTANWVKMGEGVNGIAAISKIEYNKNYCFRIKSKDFCQNIVSSLNTLCTISLQAKPTQIDEMEVSWSIPELQKYLKPKVTLERAEEGCTFCKIDSIKIQNPELNIYIDKNLDWRKKYTYKLNYMEYDTVISQTRRFRGVESFKVTQGFESQITGNEITRIKEFEVYPNPSSNRVSLKFNFLQTKMPIIEIFDISGKTNKINNFSIVQDGLDTTIDFDLKELALKPGLYFIKASSDKWQNIYKFLFE
ncbi:MAG: T9SS type A sorting domain-containing protein [Leadbetterella sp.]|nr:T9SS type A sorting domain-containing protein [Leadbetterella sp.]